MTDGQGEEPSVLRDRSITYLELPSSDTGAMRAFYTAVFGWLVDPDYPSSFSDGSRHVIGHFVDHLEVAGEAGPRPYVYVDDIDAALDRIRDAGGTVVRDRYVEGGSLWVATFRDPSGNVLGVWQQIPEGSRESSAEG
jgi:predicted enzyme related to lactoylglutathione lyase